MPKKVGMANGMDIMKEGSMYMLVDGMIEVGRYASKEEAKEVAETLQQDRKSTRLNSSHITRSRMPSSA